MLEKTPSPTQESLNIQDIMAMIPHRYPFLLVDRVTELKPGKYVKGYKNVSINEPFFQGHFPNNPIMPGVLIVESLAQLGSILIASMPENEDRLVLFAGIDKIRFRRKVIPGDKLELYAELLKLRSSIGKAYIRATIDGELATEGEILFGFDTKNQEE